MRPTTRPAAPPPGWCSATRYWRRTRAPNGISIGDHRTTWDLDANDLIRTSATKVDIDFTHTAINTQANHKVNGNPPPTAADNTVTTDEDVAYAFQAGDFNFTDDVNADDELASVTIVRLLTAGALSLDGTEVAADQEVTRAQLDAGQLTDTPPPNASGTGYASSTFKVSDGVNESATAYTMTIDGTPVVDPVTGEPAISGTAQVGYTLTAEPHCGYVCSTQPQRCSDPRRLWVILTRYCQIKAYCRIKAAVLWFVACSYALVAVDRQNPGIRCARRHEGSLMTNEPWVSVDDLAKHLGVAKDSVYRWIDHKGLPAHKIGRLWKFKLSEVDDWVRDGGASGDEPGQDGKGRRG